MDKAGSFSEFLRKVLKAIDFRGDQDSFIERFLNVIFQRALLELAMGLPPDKRDSIKNELKGSSSVGDMAEVINKYFSSQSVQTAVFNASQKMMEEYIQSILPTLSAHQIEELEKIAQDTQAFANMRND